MLMLLNAYKEYSDIILTHIPVCRPSPTSERPHARPHKHFLYGLCKEDLFYFDVGNIKTILNLYMY